MMNCNIPDWVTWVFSGIGVAVIGWGISCFSKKDNNQSVGDNNSGNVTQINGDNNHVGK